jgi:hypothetical protein
MFETKRIVDPDIERFIQMIQEEISDDIREHVYTSQSDKNEKVMVMKLLARPITDYVTAMLIDNLMSKDILSEEAIRDEFE